LNPANNQQRPGRIFGNKEKLPTVKNDNGKKIQVGQIMENTLIWAPVC